MEKEYLSEEEYQRNAKKLKKIGKIILILGVCILVFGFILLVLGFLGFGSVFGGADDMERVGKGIFGGFGLMALGGILDSIGSTAILIGGIIMFIAHRREITAFTTQQVMPVAKEGIEKMAPTAGVVAKEITKGIKEGLNSVNKNEEE